MFSSQFTLLATTAILLGAVAADKFVDTDDCLHVGEATPAVRLFFPTLLPSSDFTYHRIQQFHYGLISGDQWDWIAADGGVKEGSILKHQAPGTYDESVEGSYGLYAEAGCRTRNSDAGSRIAVAG